MEQDDPYALASTAYVEDYNFDIPEGMDLMVHRRSLDGSGTQRDDQADMVPVCQMVSCVTRNGWDAFNDASWTETADVDGPRINDSYQWTVSSDEEDFVISDVGSIADVSWDMSEEEELINSDVEPAGNLVIIRMRIVVVIQTWDLWRILKWNTWDDACALAFWMQRVHFRRIRLWSGRRWCSGTVYCVKRSVTLPLRIDGWLGSLLVRIDMLNGRVVNTLAGTLIMFDCAYCTLIVWRIYWSYETDLSTIRD